MQVRFRGMMMIKWSLDETVYRARIIVLVRVIKYGTSQRA